MLAQARAVGVSNYIVPATGRFDWQAVLSLQMLSGVRAVAVGIHPWFAHEHDADAIDELATILIKHPHVWVGEIGLDFRVAVEPADRSIQLMVFEQQLELAKIHHRPMIVHDVRASAVIVEMLKRQAFDGGGIIHGFSGSLEEAKLFIKLGFKIGIGSLLLNPNAKKARCAAAKLPIESLLLETDSPYMQPNDANVPANAATIMAIIATLRQTPIEKLAEQFEKNLLSLLAT